MTNHDFDGEVVLVTGGGASLASENASFITGSYRLVDGGCTAL